MKARNIKVIFDTNVWISFLIGKRLSFIKKFIADGQLTIVITDQLIEEIKVVIPIYHHLVQCNLPSV